MEKLDDHPRWFALFTASNHEKNVERQLKRKEIQTFLPLYTSTRRWKNRTTVQVQLPLFAGYVFAKFSRNEVRRVLETSMLYSVVGNKQGFLPISDSEIDALQRGLDTETIEPSPEIRVGQLARIRTGALSGWEGIVTRVEGGLRVVLAIESVQRCFAVHVGADDIELLGEVIEAGTDGKSQIQNHPTEKM